MLQLMIRMVTVEIRLLKATKVLLVTVMVQDSRQAIRVIQIAQIMTRITMQGRFDLY